MPPYCLIYTSVANQKMTDETLKALLTKSRLKNASLSITGMLLYLDPYFMQILEGTEATVTESFNIIKQDPRHHKVRLIYKKPIEARAFPNWTMGFNKINPDNFDAVEGFTDFWQKQTADFFSASPTETEKVLTHFLERFKDESLF
ncbi:MAG: BLUF domain-containing protein [Methylococcales bacterium]